MLSDEKAEILSDSYHYLTELNVKTFSPEKKILISTIPRDSNKIPVIFEKHKRFNIVLTNFEKIYFFQVTFLKMAIYDDTPCYFFKTKEFKAIINNRKENRMNVEFQGVLTDHKKNRIVHILDISGSGAKLETEDMIDSEFVELFFEENNEKRVIRSKIIWKHKPSGYDKFLYGLEFQKEKPS